MDCVESQIESTDYPRAAPSRITDFQMRVEFEVLEDEYRGLRVHQNHINAAADSPDASKRGNAKERKESRQAETRAIIFSNDSSEASLSI
jgi:hypothetical protein